jgi:hypothetical protein
MLFILSAKRHTLPGSLLMTTTKPATNKTSKRSIMMMMKKKNALRAIIVAAVCLSSSTTTAKLDQDHEEAPMQSDMSDVTVTISQGNTDLTPQSMKVDEKPDQEFMFGETKVTVGNVDQLEVKPDATEATGTSAAAAAARQYAVTLLFGAAAGVFSCVSMM